MSAAWTKRAEELFDVACTLPPEARGDFLAEVCGEDQALRDEIASLLTARDRANRYFNSLGERLGLAAILDENFELPEQDQIGSYRLIRLLGRGGMGAVYLAERADQQFEKRVALKILPFGMGSAEMRRRFLAERQMLARLVHPNIARLLDGGVTDRGTPYFVMDYVEGTPIDEYCDRHRLTLRERLDLFRKVCEAVQYAHRNLIVHRDLKPGNVLVEESGEVKLLDFGIAKALDPESTYAGLTRVGAHPMTPLYASPEMIRGEGITTAADVYSLGVLLYVLATGRYPYPTSAGSDVELWRIVCEEEPMPPSKAVLSPETEDAPAPDELAPLRRKTPQRLHHELRGDLDIIILKALKKDANERYATVNALVEDLQRHLEGRPLLARPDTHWYAFRKFVGRNKLAVGAATAVLMAVLISAGVSLWQAKIAISEKQRAEEVKAFIASIFRSADPYTGDGETLSVTELLQQAKASIDRRFEDRPALRVELLNVVGASLMTLHDLDTAEAVLNEAETEGASNLQPDHPERLRTQQLLVSMDRWRGNTTEMREKLEQLLPALRAEPDMYASEIVRALKDRAHAALDEAKFDEAEVAALEAIDVASAKLDPLDPEAIAPLNVLALAYLSNKKPDLALQAAERAYRMTLRAYDGNVRQPQVIDARAIYGRTLGVNGHVDRAIEELTAVVADALEVFGPAGRQVGFYSQHLVDYELQRGHVKDALSNAQRAFDILGAVAGPKSFTYGAGLNSRGRCHLMARHAEEAVRDLSGAVDVATHLLGPHHEITRRTRVVRALALVYAGDMGAAQAELRAYTGGGEAERDAPWSLPSYALGTLNRLSGEYEEALQRQKDALSHVEQDYRGQPGARQHVLTEIGLNQVDLGDFDGAIAVLQEALALYEENENRITPQRADALVGIGRARMGLGDVDEALAALEAADAFWRDFDPGNRWAGEAALWLGRCYDTLGRSTEADDALARAESILSRSAIPSDSRLAQLARSN